MKPGIDTHVSTSHMVLGRDLNPHDTLFAGQAASYMIECGFLAVQSFLQTPHIVFLSLDGLRFLQPVHKGEGFRIDSTIIYAGSSSIGVYLSLSKLPSLTKAAECFVSFVHITEETGQAEAHHTILADLDEDAKKLQHLYLTYKFCGILKE